jgi:hypothetical protein
MTVFMGLRFCSLYFESFCESGLTVGHYLWECDLKVFMGLVGQYLWERRLNVFMGLVSKSIYGLG